MGLPKAGDKLFYLGHSEDFEDGDRLTYGQEGTVQGPATNPGVSGKGLNMHFPGNRDLVSCPVEDLSPNKPGPLPGGHNPRDRLFYTSYSHDLDNGDKLTHGQEGVVLGPATGANTVGRGVAVQFPGNKGPVNCFLDTLSPGDPGLLPGGHQPGDKLFFTGCCESFASGNKLTYGHEGLVVGPATAVTHAGRGLKMQFAGNAGRVDCTLDQLSRNQPGPLPGGHKPHDRLFFTGRCVDFDDGDKVTYGQEGVVLGPATTYTHVGQGLMMQFAGNTDPNDCFLTDLSPTRPGPLPGGHNPRATLHYTGDSVYLDNGDKITRGQAGLVMGPATHPAIMGKGLAMKFLGNQSEVDCRLSNLSPTNVGL